MKCLIHINTSSHKIHISDSKMTTTSSKHIEKAFIEDISKYENLDHLNAVIDVYWGENSASPLPYYIKVFKTIQNYYHNDGNSPWSDKTYDIMCQIMKTRYNINVEEVVGSPVKDDECKLPIYMGSMNKCKTKKEIDLWRQKYSGPYMVSAKLDGISALWSNGKMYTRGNGTYGKDISYLLPYLSCSLPNTEHCIRGELIMKTSVFREKYSKDFSNPRNLVCGIINRHFKEDNIPIYKDICFIAYDLFHVSMTYEQRFDWLSENQCEVVEHEGNIPEISPEIGDTWLSQWKSDKFDYEIDGIVWTNYGVHTYPSSGNPAYAFAYKNNDLCVSMTEGVVKTVLWNISKDQYIKPKIQLQAPIKCDQSTVEFVTGFNAKYIYDNKISNGTKLMIGLSGNVIPHIFKVTQDEEQTYDEAFYFKDVDCSYEWSKNKVDIICSEKEHFQSVIKQNTMLFKTFDMKASLQEKTLLNVYNSLNVYHLKDIINLKLENWRDVSKMGDKKATKIMNGLYDILHWEHVSSQESFNHYEYFSKLCVGLQTWERGFAMKKMRLFIDYLLTLTKNDDIDITACGDVNVIQTMVDNVLSCIQRDKPKQITQDTMRLFLSGLESFVLKIIDLKSSCSLYTIVDIHVLLGGLIQQTLETNEPTTKTPMNSYKFVFSGVRDKDTENLLIQDGHTIDERVSKDVTMLIVKNNESIQKMSSKIKKAQELDISIYTIDEFNVWYKEYKGLFA